MIKPDCDFVCGGIRDDAEASVNETPSWVVGNSHDAGTDGIVKLVVTAKGDASCSAGVLSYSQEFFGRESIEVLTVDSGYGSFSRSKRDPIIWRLKLRLYAFV